MKTLRFKVGDQVRFQIVQPSGKNYGNPMSGEIIKVYDQKDDYDYEIKEKEKENGLWSVYDREVSALGQWGDYL